MSSSNQGALRTDAMTTPQSTPASQSRPPLEAVATPARAFDAAEPLVPPPEQPYDFSDERSLLHERIALLQKALEEAHRFAHHDELTGIPNRRLLEDRFEQATTRSDRHGKQMAVLFLDIDGFKRINDAHGHTVGDGLLRQIAARLVKCVRTSDTVCRYGGDEFVALCRRSKAA